MGSTFSLNNLGNVAYYQGDFASARRYMEQSLAIQREVGDRLGLAESLEAFARLAAAEAKKEQAAMLWGCAEALREQIGVSRSPEEEHDRERAEESDLSGKQTLSEARATGRAMTLEQAIAEARRLC